MLPGKKGSFDETAVKDPTLVFFRGLWHLFYTARGKQEYTTGYVSAKTLDELNSARRHELKQIRGAKSRYSCAPQVFFFEPQNRWYLLFQTRDSNYQPTYSTTETISKPESWSTPKALLEKENKDTLVRIRHVTSRILLYAVFLFITFIVVLPVMWIFFTSLKSEDEFRQPDVSILPRKALWENYYTAVFKYPFLKHAVNTLEIAIPSTIMMVLSSSLIGYGFARLNAPGKNFLFILVLSMLMVPGMVMVIPQFILYSRLKITGTYWPWYLNAMTGSSYQIFLFRQFFASFPTELEDAAEVDGCNRFRIYWQIFLPNSLPVLAVTAISQFRSVWGDWFTARIYLGASNTTLGVLLDSAYLDPTGQYWETIRLAAIVVYMLPMIVVFFFSQKYIIKGIVTTGIKG